MKFRLFIWSIMVCVCFNKSQAQYLNTSGSWYPIIPVTAITEAGLDYGSGYAIESAANQSSIDVSVGGSFFNYLFNNYQVNIQKQDINWNANLVLSIRRTSNGSGTIFSSISGGTAYQIITGSPTGLYQATGNYSNVQFQYKLSGLSVLIPVNSYSTTIVYTLIDI